MEKEITITVDVDGEYSAPRSGVRYTSNGDGWPDEPAEYSITKVTLMGVDITKALEEYGFDFAALEQEILDSL